VKKLVEITLSTLHLGSARRVVTLAINGKDPAEDFLSKLLKDDRSKLDSITSRIKAIASYPRYENKITFRDVGDGIYEFKRPGLRLYAFYAEINGQDQLILCTNGGIKNKDQQKDIRQAKALKNEFFAALKLPDTTLNLDWPDP
jgi:putative component of toxin-antitoxin plasmid stabilization module